MSRLKASASETSLHLKSSFSTDELFRIMTVLNRLVPFIFAGVLQSLTFTQPSDAESCEELVLEGEGDKPAVSEVNGGEKENSNEPPPSNSEGRRGELKSPVFLSYADDAEREFCFPIYHVVWPFLQENRYP